MILAPMVPKNETELTLFRWNRKQVVLRVTSHRLDLPPLSHLIEALRIYKAAIQWKLSYGALTDGHACGSSSANTEQLNMELDVTPVSCFVSMRPQNCHPKSGSVRQSPQTSLVIIRWKHAERRTTLSRHARLEASVCFKAWEIHEFLLSPIRPPPSRILSEDLCVGTAGVPHA